MADININSYNGIKINIVNQLTGEIMELKIDSVDDARRYYFEIKALLDQVSAAEKAIKKFFEDFLDTSGEEVYEFADGSTAKWVRGETVEYRKDVVAKYLDEDQMDLVTKVSTTAVKTLLKEMVKKGELENGAFADIEDNAYRVPKKPYISISKPK